jgi:hypothetical protein
MFIRTLRRGIVERTVMVRGGRSETEAEEPLKGVCGGLVGEFKAEE